MHQARRFAIVSCALCSLLLATGAAAAAQIVDISRLVADQNAAIKRLGLSVECPVKVTVGVWFTCTYSNTNGQSAPVDLIVRTAGKGPVSANDKAATAVISNLVPVSTWLKESLMAYNSDAKKSGVTLSCPSALSVTTPLSCTLTSKNGKRTQPVAMRFAPLKSFGYVLKPVSTKQYAAAVILVR